MPTATDRLSVDAWRHDPAALGSVGRRLWIAALAALVALAAVIGPILIFTSPADAHPQLNCWDVEVERNTGGTVTWTETVRHCVAVDHPHPPPPQIVQDIEHLISPWGKYAICGPLAPLCAFTNENDGH